MKTRKQLIDFEHKGNEKHHSKLRPALLSLCMLTFIGVYSQTGQVNLNLKNATVKELFREIEKQTSYRFSYRDIEINNKGGITISGQGKELKEVLTNELAKQELTYVVSGNKIIVSPAKKESASAKDKKITGKVIDAKGEPVIGATVMEKGTTNGTITDFDGNFTINVSDNSMLEVSYVGYQTQSVKATYGKNLAITLKEDTELLDEVVIVGYGTQKKVNLTGSISTVNFDENISSRPILNASSALAGLSAGVQIQQTSGKPGASGATIRVRGTGTLNSNNPLVLVDGIEWDMNNVNTEDIASISILKDAASAAIYGSRAANGVILVTTKKGKGKAKISYSFNGAIQKAQNKLEFISDYSRHMELINEGAENMGRGQIFNQSTIDKWKEAKLSPNGLNEYGVPNYIAYPNTDWFNEIIGTGFSQKHNIAINGSNEKTNYFVSIGYLNTDGIMNQKGMNSGLRQIHFRTNLEIKINDWLTIGTRLNGLKQNQGLTNIDNGFKYLSQTTPGVYPGEPNKWGVPAAIEESTTANNIFGQMNREGYDKMFRGNFTLYGSINPIRGFSIEGSYNYAPDWGDYATWGKPNGTWNYTTNQRQSESALENASIFNKSFKRHRENSEILIKYNSDINNIHEIGVLGGFTTSYYKESSFGVTRKGMTDWQLTELNTATELVSSESNETDWALISYFARLNYAFKEKYLFEANMRYDGSSRFSPDSRWGLFPSFSLGWRINEEEFMDFSKSILSNLKIRASWGKLGNNASGNYDWQANYNSQNVVIDSSPYKGLYIDKLGNNALKWETTTITNIGFDFGFFDNKLYGEFDWYNKVTSGILFTPSIPITMGYITGSTENIAKVQNKGIELTVGWRDNIKNFKYEISGYFSYNNNKVIKYKGKLSRYWEYDDKGYPIRFVNNYGDVAQSGFGGVIVEGRMLGEMYLRQVYKGKGTYSGGKPDPKSGPTDGIIRTQQDMDWVQAMLLDGYTFNGVNKISKDQLWYGDIIYEDSNGDGNYGDTNDQNFTGTSSQPKYNFGLNLSASYKGIDLYMLWAGSAGFDLYWNHSSYNGTQTKNGYGISKRVADNHYFYNPNDPNDPRTNIMGKYPRLTDQTQRDNALPSNFWKYNGNYLKLKNIQIGYSLPKKIISKLFVENLRLYISGENLITITKYPGLDPEIGNSVTYPLTKQFSFGVQLSL